MEYMKVFKNISTATASRDIKKGVGLHYFSRSGDKNKAIYKIATGHNGPYTDNAGTSRKLACK